MIYILIGFKGSGKTSIGTYAAEKLNLPFYDTDSLIEKHYEQEHRVKKTCRQIYKDHGEDFFRDLESFVILHLDFKVGILAVGGGALDREENISALKKLGKLIYIKEDKHILFKRLSTQDIPFLHQVTKQTDFENLFKQRSRVYERVADLTLQSSGLTIHEAGEELIQVI